MRRDDEDMRRDDEVDTLTDGIDVDTLSTLLDEGLIDSGLRQNYVPTAKELHRFGVGLERIHDIRVGFTGYAIAPYHPESDARVSITGLTVRPGPTRSTLPIRAAILLGETELLRSANMQLIDADHGRWWWN
jgi:hypothetical protein